MIQPVKVAQGIYRGARPNSELEMGVLKILGIKTILNLESGPLEASMATLDRELAWAAKAGIVMQHLRLSEILPPTLEQLQTAIRILRNQECLPIYIHCKWGKDRTGIVAGVFESVVLGQPYQEVYNRMIDLGFHLDWYWYWIPQFKKLCSMSVLY